VKSSLEGFGVRKEPFFAISEVLKIAKLANFSLEKMQKRIKIKIQSP